MKPKRDFFMNRKIFNSFSVTFFYKYFVFLSFFTIQKIELIFFKL